MLNSHSGDRYVLSAAGPALHSSFVAAAALLLARVLSSFSHLLYGVRAGDPMTLAIVSVVLVSTSAFACYLPARRATHVDPMIALRHE